ncbi:hypothetical protein V865_003542 [Kwoniella europaea PYCC6329]|uniref:HIT domain-containing protein n=1 Tax=Kwoniella europaea PYCC6329 TaxID=1423913 RepID=A0AAX4KGE7_9TREE
MPSFSSCFPSSSSKTNNPIQDPLISSTTGGSKVVKGCIFCNSSKENGFNIVYEDNQLIAFHDRKPRAKIHLLIIPREHVVSSVKQLTKEHLPLLDSMRSLATSLVPDRPPPKMGFHIPPFSSVPHLHLHVFSGPHTLIGRLKYPIARRGRDIGKGWSWFVTIDQVEKILQDGGKVGLGTG